MSARDALALEPEFAPELRAADLARLGQYELAIKLSVDGVTTLPFTAVSAVAHRTGWSPAVASTAVGPLIAAALVWRWFPETTGKELEETSAIH